MSPAEADVLVIGRATGATPVRHWWRLLRSELRIVFLRPRNLALLGVLGAAPVFLGAVLRISPPGPGAGEGPGGALILQVTGNGVFLSVASIFFLLALMLPLAVAVVSGDSVAGEAGLGTLRTLLIVPAGRFRLVATKYVSIVVFCLAAYSLIAVISLVMGAL